MKLFEPGKIGKLALKNRIVMAAMGNRLVEPDGRLSQRGIDFYMARARGGAGLIMTSCTYPRNVEPLPSAPFVERMVIDGKIYAGPLNELADGAHDYGAAVALQVSPGHGLMATGGQVVGPSAQPAFRNPAVMARALTTEEVGQLAGKFRVMGEVARIAGIDAIEINAHESGLCDDFMTALWNKRTDKYGGDLDGRLRFLLEIIENIKKGAGDDFPVMVKYGLTHYIPGGREIDEGLEIARKLEKAGAAALEIDAGSFQTLTWYKPTTYSPRGCLVHLAAMVKKVVSIPVIAVGKLGYPELAESVLQEGKADFIGLARPLLSDPDWANKVKEGRREDIAPCVGDYDGCNGRTYEGLPISCTVNPACGMEREMAICPADRKKSVLIVGGGPGGMEAARVAALRGHKVTLLEKGDALGGNLIPASVPDFKEDYRDLISYLSKQVEKLGVDVRLSTEATPGVVRKMKPDAVLVATGSTPVIPEIPGVGKKHVVAAGDALTGKRDVGKSVAVIGGGAVGCETALHLSRKGKSVTIVEVLDSLAGDMFAVSRFHLIDLLRQSGVRMLTGTRVLEITDKGVTIADKGGKKSTLAVDTVLLAVGMKPDDGLARSLRDKVPELYTIGDCVTPGRVMNAIKQGSRLARRL